MNVTYYIHKFWNLLRSENSAFNVRRIIVALGAQNKETPFGSHLTLLFFFPVHPLLRQSTCIFFTESHQLQDTAKLISLMGAHWYSLHTLTVFRRPRNMSLTDQSANSASLQKSNRGRTSAQSRGSRCCQWLQSCQTEKGKGTKWVRQVQ